MTGAVVAGESASMRMSRMHSALCLWWLYLDDSPSQLSVGGCIRVMMSDCVCAVAGMADVVVDGGMRAQAMSQMHYLL